VPVDYVRHACERSAEMVHLADVRAIASKRVFINLASSLWESGSSRLEVDCSTGRRPMEWADEPPRHLRTAFPIKFLRGRPIHLEFDYYFPTLKQLTVNVSVPNIFNPFCKNRHTPTSSTSLMRRCSGLDTYNAVASPKMSLNLNATHQILRPTSTHD